MVPHFHTGLKLYLPANDIAGLHALKTVLGGACAASLEFPGHQLSRSVSCSSREFWPEVRLERIPSEPIAFGLLPGMLKTLKKSALIRSFTVSEIATVLKSDASTPHCRTPGKYCCRQGCRLSLYVVLCTAPFFNGIHTVLVSQNCCRLVLAGAFAGSVVDPQGI